MDNLMIKTTVREAPPSVGRGRGKAGLHRHKKLLTDSSRCISRVEIRRLARQAGVKRIHGMVYEYCREILKNFLRAVIADAASYAEYARRRTVNAMDVVYALKRQGGRTLYGFSS